MKENRIKRLACGKDVCKRCETEVTYSEKFDTFYCTTCNLWLEERCVDPLCKMCAKRPIRPLKKTKIKTKKKKPESIEWKI